MEDLRYLVLSERNCLLGDLREAVQHLWKSFEKLRHRKIWAKVLGTIAALEITFKTWPETWHPHLNVIFRGPFILQRLLLKAWNEITAGNGEAGVYIEKADQGSIRELFKYVTKVSDFADSPEALRWFLRETKGLRFIRTYGCFYGLEKEEEPEHDVCPDCGSSKVSSFGTFKQVLFDSTGVYRLPVEVLRESFPQDWGGP